jgi:hypothetical protein
MPQNKITVLKEQEEWSANFNEEIVGVMVNGNRLNDVHDLVVRIDKISKVIKTLSFSVIILTLLGFAPLCFVGYWVFKNNSDIVNVIDTTQFRFSKRISVLNSDYREASEQLKSLGYVRRGKTWEKISQN